MRSQTGQIDERVGEGGWAKLWDWSPDGWSPEAASCGSVPVRGTVLVHLILMRNDRAGVGQGGESRVVRSGSQNEPRPLSNKSELSSP